MFTAPLAQRLVSDAFELEHHAWWHVHSLEHRLDVALCGATACPHGDHALVAKLTHEEVAAHEERVPNGLEVGGGIEHVILHIPDLLSWPLTHVEWACAECGLVQRVRRRADDVLTTTDVIASNSEGYDSGLRLVVGHDSSLITRR